MVPTRSTAGIGIRVCPDAQRDAEGAIRRAKCVKVLALVASSARHCSQELVPLKVRAVLPSAINVAAEIGIKQEIDYRRWNLLLKDSWSLAVIAAAHC